MDKCMCRKCIKTRGDSVEWSAGVTMPYECARMILCETCGNKRCPHANDHDNICTNSNEPGQPGSAY